MRQTTFASIGFGRYEKRTRRAVFLQEMERIVPWQRLSALIEPHYPKPGNGRRPIGLERMLRIYFLQHWFALSDPGAEEALYESEVMRRFVGIDLGREPVPDETTILNFRRLLEQNLLCARIIQEVNTYLDDRGIRISTGTIMDATIIAAPSSTKNQSGQRDPDMHQTRKGNQWYFGMKAHIGVDSKEKLIHSVVATPANTHDGAVIEDLLHGEETRVWGDQAYRGKRAEIRKHAPRASDFTNRRYRWKNRVDPVEKARNRTKSKVRAKVEHCFHVMKRVFGFVKVRYKGLDKNADWLFVSCALVNLFMCRRRLSQA
jgi:IS5 family transposase